MSLANVVSRVAVVSVVVFALRCAAASPVPTSSPSPSRPTAEAQSPRRVLPGYIRGNRNSHAQRVIVFVHGIFGDGDSTWRNANQTYFPDLVANDEAFEHADVWVHDFPSAKLRRGYSIDELAENLHDYLVDDNVFSNHEEVIFVGHSMGGLVIRDYLLMYRPPAASVPMIFFYSTPTTGSDLANLASFVSRNPQLVDMRKMSSDASTFVDTLQSLWTNSDYVRKTTSYCAYEKLPTHGFQIVERESATNLCNAPLTPILTDHIDIVKPADQRSPSYVAFRNAFRETFATTSVSQRPAWNLTTTGDRDLFSVANYTRNPGRNDAWRNQTTAAPGDVIAFDLHYWNGSDAAAHDARLRINLPTEPFNGEADITASIWSDDTAAAHGKVLLTARSAPIMLVPETSAEWYPNAAGSASALPYDQASASIFAPQGLRVGDVHPGWTFRSDVIVRVRCLPASVTVLRNMLHRFVEGGSGLNVSREELSRQVEQSESETQQFVETFVVDGRPRWANAVRGLQDEDDLLVYAFFYNTAVTPLHNVRLNVERDLQQSDVFRLTFATPDATLQTNDIHLYFRDPALEPAFIGASMMRPGEFAQTFVPSSVKFPEGDPSSGIVIGDISPRSEIVVTMSYEVAPRGTRIPRSVQEAAIAAFRKHFGAGSQCGTTVDGGSPDAGIVAVGDERDNGWHPTFENVKPGEKVAFMIRYHNAGDCPAFATTAHIAVATAKTAITVHASLTSENAPRRDGDATMSVAGARTPLDLQPIETRWFWDDALIGVPLDHPASTTADIPLGDIASGESGSLVFYYKTQR